MELKEAIEILEAFEPDDLFECALYRHSITEIKNYIEKLENRYLELIINGKSFKVKNDVKKLQYIDYGNKEFTLEVLEKWN